MVFLMMSKEEGYLCTGKAFIYQWLGRMSTSGSECWVVPTLAKNKKWGYSHAIKTFLLRSLHNCNCSLCCSGRRSGHAWRISSSNGRKMIPHWSIPCLSTHPSRSRSSWFVSTSLCNASHPRSGHAWRISSSNRRKMIPYWSIPYLFIYSSRSRSS